MAGIINNALYKHPRAEIRMEFWLSEELGHGTCSFDGFCCPERVSHLKVSLFLKPEFTQVPNT